MLINARFQRNNHIVEIQITLSPLLDIKVGSQDFQLLVLLHPHDKQPCLLPRLLTILIVLEMLFASLNRILRMTLCVTLQSGGGHAVYKLARLLELNAKETTTIVSD